MKAIRKLLYWANVLLLGVCAVVFAWTRISVLLIKSSEVTVPFRLEAGFSADRHFHVYHSGMYDVGLRITKREGGRPTMEPEQLMALTTGDRVDVEIKLLSRDSTICSGSTPRHAFLGSTDAAYYLGVGTVRLSRGNTYTLRGTSRASVPELTSTSPSLILMFSPSANKSFNVGVGVLSWLALRVGLISGVVFAIITVNRARRRRSGTQQPPA